MQGPWYTTCEITPNKVLRLTAISLRTTAAGELGRYGCCTVPRFHTNPIRSTRLLVLSRQRALV